MHVIAQTPRLIIKTFSAKDEEAYLTLFDDVQVREHLPKRTREENRKIFRDTLVEDTGGAIFSKWAVVDRTNNDFIGMCLLRAYNDTADILEIGYAIHVKYWGQGITTELTNALIGYVKTHPQINAIVAVTTPSNIASQKVLEKAGLRYSEIIIRNNEEVPFYRMDIR